MSIDFTGITGVSDDYGVVTQIADASGRVLWSANSWPEDLDTGLEFVSASPFTISVAKTGWAGTMEYCNGSGWKTWNGSEISSGKTESGQCIYIRGTGNTRVTGTSASYKWTLTGTDIKCNGNIGNLQDYAAVKAGSHPNEVGATYAYAYMFLGCTALTSAPTLPATNLSRHAYDSMFQRTSLTSAPTLPATNLGDSCYAHMFRECTALTSIPRLPATTLFNSCYDYMFYGCTKIKLSKSKSGTYTTAYRIPISGTGTPDDIGMSAMFNLTGGTFKGTPTINTTYYLDASNTIV